MLASSIVDPTFRPNQSPNGRQELERRPMCCVSRPRAPPVCTGRTNGRSLDLLWHAQRHRSRPRVFRVTAEPTRTHHTDDALLCFFPPRCPRESRVVPRRYFAYTYMCFCLFFVFVLSNPLFLRSCRNVVLMSAHGSAQRELWEQREALGRGRRRADRGHAVTG